MMELFKLENLPHSAVSVDRLIYLGKYIVSMQRILYFIITVMRRRLYFDSFKPEIISEGEILTIKDK